MASVLAMTCELMLRVRCVLATLVGIVYAHDGKTACVYVVATARVQRLSPSFKIDNCTMGSDPCVGKVKTLRVVYTVDKGPPRHTEVLEGSNIHLLTR